MSNASARETIARARTMSLYQRDQQDLAEYILWESRYFPGISGRLGMLARRNYELMSEVYLDYVFG